MDKFLLLVAIFGLLLFGCISGEAKPVVPKTNGGSIGINVTSASSEELAACENTVPFNIKNWCFLNISLRTRNVSYCEKIVDINSSLHQKNGCYFEMALLNSDPDLCAKVEPYSKSYCYTNISLVRKDLALCDQITDSEAKGRCYSQFAVVTRNISLCDAIQVEASGTSYNFVTHQQSQYGPAEITREARESCYGGVANALGDESICERIQSPTIKDSCYEYMDYTKLIANPVNN